jgi:hypothetical protein
MMLFNKFENNRRLSLGNSESIPNLQISKKWLDPNDDLLGESSTKELNREGRIGRVCVN